MSNYISVYPDSVPLNQSISQMQAIIIGKLTACGWQQIAFSDGAWTDVIPPATETIGTSKFREVVRVYFTGTSITIGSYQVCIADAFPQAIMLTAKTAGAVAAAVTIDGVTVTGATGSSGSTANDNLRALYYALRDSADATIQGWTHTYNGTDTIISTRKTIAANVVCSGNANVAYSLHASAVLAGQRSAYATNDAGYGYSVTTDLASGFIYYMEVDSRSFRLGTKCLSGVYGEIFATYVDHAEALAVLPNSPRCTPIELVIGTSNNDSTARGRLTHWWGIPMASGYNAIPNVDTSSPAPVYWNTNPDWHPFSGSAESFAVSDVGLHHCGYSGTGTQEFSREVTLGKLGISRVSGQTDAFRVAPLASGPVSFDTYAGYQTSTRFIAGLNLSDIRKWSGSEPNEACAWAAVPPVMAPSAYTLQQAMDAATDYTAITLNTTAGLPPTGSVQIGLEKIDYAGISGATLTGPTRGADGTGKARHFVGDPVLSGQWFLKVNYSALCCGPVKPF